VMLAVAGVAAAGSRGTARAFNQQRGEPGL
jgi:hypothetical protein